MMISLAGYVHLHDAEESGPNKLLKKKLLAWILFVTAIRYVSNCTLSIHLNISKGIYSKHLINIWYVFYNVVSWKGIGGILSFHSPRPWYLQLKRSSVLHLWTRVMYLEALIPQMQSPAWVKESYNTTLTVVRVSN